MSVVDWHSCICGKRSYHAKGDAKTVRRSMAEKGLGVYRCPISGGWHLGHKPRLLVRGRISRDDIYQRPGARA